MYSIKFHLRKAGQPASGEAAWGILGSTSPRKPRLPPTEFRPQSCRQATG